MATAFLFLVTLFVGDTIGPSAPATAGTYALCPDFQHGGVVHTVEFTIEVQEGQA